MFATGKQLCIIWVFEFPKPVLLIVGDSVRQRGIRRTPGGLTVTLGFVRAVRTIGVTVAYHQVRHARPGFALKLLSIAGLIVCKTSFVEFLPGT